jgi:NAD(P)-dependent dehydrogenase (short-subunit alcohol dehydrogenase family)
LFTRIVERYRNRTAVVIGAGGIGGAIAQLLADHDVKVVVADQNANLLKGLSAAIKTSLVRQFDVRDPSAVNEFFGEIDSIVGPPDYLFYTAGILNLEPLSETSSELWERAVAINLNGAFYCIQSVAERMRAQKRGSIIVLGSIAGTKARSGSRVNPVYNATKAGLAAFVNAAAMQLRRDGVRINCISPGPTTTSMMDLQPPSVHTAVNELTLDGRMNDPTEVAELALFIAAHGRFTGEEVSMGGGAGLGG